jgi:putative transposase
MRVLTFRRTHAEEPFTEAQIIGVLQETTSGAAVKEVTRRHGISEQTYYRWKAQYGGLLVDDAKRLKALEDENRRLKRIVVDQALNLSVLKDALGQESRQQRSGEGLSPMSSRTSRRLAVTTR